VLQLALKMYEDTFGRVIPLGFQTASKQRLRTTLVPSVHWKYAAGTRVYVLAADLDAVELVRYGRELDSDSVTRRCA
jgi:hypothetical protein